MTSMQRLKAIVLHCMTLEHIKHENNISEQVLVPLEQKNIPHVSLSQPGSLVSQDDLQFAESALTINTGDWGI